MALRGLATPTNAYTANCGSHAEPSTAFDDPYLSPIVAGDRADQALENWGIAWLAGLVAVGRRR